MILAAVRSTAIVTSMFPSNVRDRLYKEVDDKEMHRKQKGNLKTYLRESTGSIPGKPDSKTTPLADLFAETTVLVCEFELRNIYCVVFSSNFDLELTLSFTGSLQILQASRHGAQFVNLVKFSFC